MGIVFIIFFFDAETIDERPLLAFGKKFLHLHSGHFCKVHTLHKPLFSGCGGGDHRLVSVMNQTKYIAHAEEKANNNNNNNNK